jgi:hypothetical protein
VILHLFGCVSRSLEKKRGVNARLILMENNGRLRIYASHKNPCYHRCALLQREFLHIVAGSGHASQRWRRTACLAARQHCMVHFLATATFERRNRLREIFFVTLTLSLRSPLCPGNVFFIKFLLVRCSALRITTLSCLKRPKKRLLLGLG